MTSPQVYRPASTLEKALQEIRQNSGLLYDSDIVAITLSVIEEKEFNFGTR
jgi:HD-GYP domain-containing protein (c-di-GMP phosphodiesterase class II)